MLTLYINIFTQCAVIETVRNHIELFIVRLFVVCIFLVIYTKCLSHSSSWKICVSCIYYIHLIRNYSSFFFLKFQLWNCTFIFVSRYGLVDLAVWKQIFHSHSITICKHFDRILESAAEKLYKTISEVRYYPNKTWFLRFYGESSSFEPYWLKDWFLKTKNSYGSYWKEFLLIVLNRLYENWNILNQKNF